MRDLPPLWASALVAALAIATPLRSAVAGETESKTLFAEGRELRTSGRCVDAIPVFRRALDTFPEGLGALRNIAECEEELARFASARRSYWDLRLAAAQSSSSKYEGWDTDAEKKHGELAAKVAKLTITLRGTSPEGLEVRVDGAPFDPRLFGVEIEQDNGNHEVSATLGSRPPMVKAFEAVTGGRHAIELDMGGFGPEPMVPTRPPPAEEEASTDGKGMRVGGIVALGVAGAGLIGMGISLGIRESAIASVDETCPARRRCSPTLQPDVDRGETASALVNVFAATALVGAAVGITLLVLAPEDAGGAAGSPRATLALTPRPGGAFLGLGGAL